MKIIPLQAVPNQEFNVVLGIQQCTIKLQTLYTGLYIDLYVNNSPIVQSVICQNLNRIVRDSYLGFVGDLEFNDTQGVQDPIYSGLGARYELRYLEATDL